MMKPLGQSHLKQCLSVSPVHHLMNVLILYIIISWRFHEWKQQYLTKHCSFLCNMKSNFWHFFNETFFFFLKEEVEILNMNWIIIKKDRGNILSRVMNLLFLFFFNGSQKEHEGSGQMRHGKKWLDLIAWKKNPVYFECCCKNTSDQVEIL